MQKSPYIYHGADVSYFSGKVRPAPAEEPVVPQSPNMKEIIAKTGVAFIPVLLTPDGDAWQDTSTILDRLEAAHPNPPLYPATPVQRVVAYLIELYGDEVGILPAMHYRWSFEESTRKARIDFALGSGDREAANRFADRMAQGKNMLGVSDSTAPAIEAHLRTLLDALCAHFEEHRFLLGDSMSLADCGLMGPFYGHLFRDAVPERLLLETAFRVCCWIERMNRPPIDQKGWLPGDALAPTLKPVLRAMADGVPMLLDAAAKIDAWADASAGSAPPRAIGMVDTTFRDTKLSLLCRPYTLWMLQRPLDAYAGLGDSERARVDAALAGTGWEALLAHRPRHRMGKRGNDLARALRPVRRTAWLTFLVRVNKMRKWPPEPSPAPKPRRRGARDRPRANPFGRTGRLRVARLRRRDDARDRRRRRRAAGPRHVPLRQQAGALGGGGRLGVSRARDGSRGGDGRASRRGSGDAPARGAEALRPLRGRAPRAAPLHGARGLPRRATSALADRPPSAAAFRGVHGVDP
jgi:glutathione S-transferase